MCELNRGIYGTEFRPIEGPFGLSCAQLRVQKIVHNAGWYNKRGHKIGWGDLSANDFMRISREICYKEFFAVMSEMNSFWEFLEEVRDVGILAQTVPWINTPGFTYVVDHARFIIGKNCLYILEPQVGDTFMIDGLTFTVIKRNQAAQILRHSFYVV